MGRGTTHRIRRALSAIVLLGVVAAAGCASEMGPAPNSSFLPDPERMAPLGERFPFDRVWIREGYDRDRYERVLIKPVDTGHLLGIDWTRQQQSTRESAKLRGDANQIANRMWQALRSAFYYDPNQRLKLTEKPRSNTLMLEMAVVQVLDGSFGRRTVAIECAIKDARSRQILAMFADRQYGRPAKLVDGWALQLVELVNTPVDFQVR